MKHINISITILSLLFSISLVAPRFQVFTLHHLLFLLALILHNSSLSVC